MVSPQIIEGSLSFRCEICPIDDERLHRILYHRVSLGPVQKHRSSIDICFRKNSVTSINFLGKSPTHFLPRKNFSDEIYYRSFWNKLQKSRTENNITTDRFIDEREKYMVFFSN